MQFTGNDTDLGFLVFFALITTQVSNFFSLSGFDVVGQGPLASFLACSRNILMIKRSPVCLFNRYCYFHMCHNKHCQLSENTSFF